MDIVISRFHIKLIYQLLDCNKNIGGNWLGINICEASSQVDKNYLA